MYGLLRVVRVCIELVGIEWIYDKIQQFVVLQSPTYITHACADTFVNVEVYTGRQQAYTHHANTHQATVVPSLFHSGC